MDDKIDTSLVSLTNKHRSQILEMEQEYFGQDAILGGDLEVIINSIKWNDVIYVDSKSNDILGYAFTKAVKSKDDMVVDGKHIVLMFWIARIVVRRDCRYRGIGKLLHNSIAVPGFAYRIHVPESWLYSQMWLKALGWKATYINDRAYKDQLAYTFVKYEPVDTD